MIFPNDNLFDPVMKQRINYPHGNRIKHKCGRNKDKKLNYTDISPKPVLENTQNNSH